MGVGGGIPDPTTAWTGERDRCDSGFLRFVKTQDNFLIQVRTVNLAKSYKLKNFRKKASHDSGVRRAGSKALASSSPPLRTAGIGKTGPQAGPAQQPSRQDLGPSAALATPTRDSWGVLRAWPSITMSP